MNIIIDKLIETSKMFSEKGQEISISKFTVFGIEISSRYGKANEIVEMINFARLAAINCCSHYVKSIFYDSKSCCCTIELCDSIFCGNEIEKTLFLIAEKTIHLFEWIDGCVYGESQSGPD